ncbi:Zn-binding Pro-Ala-Ala-Arg (PAAR) domain-containing protein, incolved in TypeVI secretion [Saccharopolyspora kobensis]|uniref:Zn-binding Pro-Ala-Ala-Arg (PAAR) domain-containing protein, incolved in TypeVI secretion n=1 Tax=Saccharopolyspora kobensis TaxID=146035 RepID=A0A1H5ZIR8_9PSEU|nr:PAAR domain-containing protein [Saccharopolyspora kobensis]SEG36142.1 Zn-binding Pro-Ala-Ala-Arg (PAAR) domain-containing protein, incolved in TypeVI secretion [Saccharopolyspora kobensis]SFF18861.1 Zn-binding Pro-Ala-Ala-Arg (PAAR) domain-containing protein, incolved in TypeVI secretion [Saccharopolyspora kobensis]
MPPAARIGDQTAHGGAVGTPPPAAAAKVATVLIGGKPAAVTGSLHVCPIPHHALLGPGNVLLPGPPGGRGAVLIGGLPAARVGDKTTCGAQIVLGAMNVQIGGGA